MSSLPVSPSSWTSSHPTRSRPSCGPGTSWYARLLSCPHVHSPQAARTGHGTKFLAWSPVLDLANRWSCTSTPADQPRRCLREQRWRNLSRHQSTRYLIYNVSCHACSVSMTSWERIFSLADENCKMFYVYHLQNRGNTVGDHWSYIHHYYRCSYLHFSRSIWEQEFNYAFIFTYFSLVPCEI